MGLESKGIYIPGPRGRIQTKYYKNKMEYLYTNNIWILNSITCSTIIHQKIKYE